MADFNEIEQLQLDNDFCQIFNKVSQHPIDDLDQNPENLNMRNVNYLQISLKSLTLNQKVLQDKPITVKVKMPMIRNNFLDYQQHQTYDIGRNGKQIIFNSQFRSNFQLTDKILGQLNLVVIYFEIESLDVEVGKAEFPLQIMIVDGLKQFTYQQSVTQKSQNKNNKKGKEDKIIEIGTIEFEIQLQDYDKNQRPTQVSPKKEIDIEEQVEKIYQRIAEQQQREQERKQLLKQQQQEQQQEQLAQQIQSFQLYLNIGKLNHLNRDLCLNIIEDEQINLFLKFKSYGTQEINTTETNWNIFKLMLNYTVTCPISMETVQKMQNFPWIIELWAKHTTRNQDILVGITRLQLGLINSSIFTHNPLISVQILKNNLYPLMIYDQDIPFEHLRSKQTIAIFKLKVAFGTSAQINRLINQEIPLIKDSSDEEPEEEIPLTEVNEPEKIPEPPKIDEPQMKEKVPLQECLITTLNKINNTIRILPKEEYILVDEFIDIVTQLCGLNFNKFFIQSLAQYLQHDEQTLDWHIFLDSWQAFSNYKKELKQNYTKIYANFYAQTIKIFPSINAFERELPHGSFGLINTQQLREFLLECKGGNIPSGPSFSAITINSVFNTLEQNSDNQVQIADLVDYLRQFELYGEINKIYVPIQQLAIVIEKNISFWMKNNKNQIDEFINNKSFRQELRAFDIIELFQRLGLTCTLLDAITIMHQIGDYNNVENLDGQKVCTEIALWQYINSLEVNQNDNEPLSPMQPSQPKVNGVKKPQPIDFQFLETQIIIDLTQLTYIEGEKFQLQLQFENTTFSVTTPKITIFKPELYDQGQIPINLRAICTLNDKFNHDFRKALFERLEFSGLNIILFRDNQISRGSLAVEEILTIQEEKETFFVQLFDEVKGVDTSLIEFKMQIKQSVRDEKPVEGFQLYSPEGQVQQEPKISAEEIMEILKPEIMHTFKINIKQINWFKQLKFNTFKVKISLATDKKILKEAIPCFVSDDFQNDFDILVEYQVKCDQVLANQISKCHLQIQLLLNCQTQNKILVGYLPIKPLFEEGRVVGDIPLDDNTTGVFCCTLNLDTIYTTDQIEQQTIQIDEKLKFQKKIIIRVLEFIVLDDKNELGEIYFMLVDPLNMSDSYEVRPNTPSILNTQDCIFIISDTELQSDVVELQVRSVMLGEDKIIGNVQIQIQQIQNEGIYSESNYLRVDTKASSLEIAARVGVKIIYVCANETTNENYLNAFRYPAIKDLEQQQNIEQYLRNKLQFSFSEINFLTSLIKNDVFSTTILQPLNIQAEKSIILDLLKEFQFYDATQLRYVNPNNLQTIFGYFNLNDCRELFIQSLHKRKPNDYDCPSNQFDYLTFLAHLQKSLPNATPLFYNNIQGPIQHEVQQVIKKSPIKHQEQDIPKLNYKFLHFHFEFGKNLNSLSKRIPNSLLKFPQLDQESKVFHCSSNPQYDALVSVDIKKLQNLQIQIFDKKYSVDEKEFYKNTLIGQAVIQFDKLKQEFPQIIQLQLENQEHSFSQTQQIPYLNIKIWTDNEEIIPIQTKKSPIKVTQTQETVRRLVFDLENNENQAGRDNTTIKNLEKDLEDCLKSIKQTKPQLPKVDEESIKEPPKSQDEEKSKKQQPKKIEKAKPQFYSSSGSSSHPNQPKSSSSGNRLEKIDEKLPINGDQLKRIEKILRQNNLPLEKFNTFDDDSDLE